MEPNGGTRSSPGDRLGRAADISGKLLIIGAAIAVLLFLFWNLRPVLVPFFLALLISTQLMPVVNWLKSKRLPPALAVTFAMALALVIFLVAVSLIVGQVVSESEGLDESLSAGADDAAAWVAANSGPFELSETEVRAEAEKLASRVTDSPGPAVNGVIGGLSAAAGVLVAVVLTLAFTVYMLSDGGRGFTWFANRFREPSRSRVLRAGVRAWTTLGNYIRGVALVAVFDAALIGGVLFILGVPLAGALTAMVFLLAFIPIVGAWVSGIIATLVALAGSGPGTAGIVAATSLAVQQLEAVAIAPMVYRRAVRLHPMVTLGAVAAGGLLAGVIGAFIAVPLVALAWAVTDSWSSAEDSVSN